MLVGIGLLVGFVSLIAAFLLEGGHANALLEPTAALIVFGGTIGAVVVSSAAEDLKRLPGIFKTIFGKQKSDLAEQVLFFKELSFKTRKNGILSLEAELTTMNDKEDFVKKGLQLVVDGVEGQTVRNIMELQQEIISERHREGAALFEAAGGFAPTMGIIGTVMGLVHVLGNLSDPGSLGPKIAVAFIATLYGVASANLLWLPIAAKLKNMDKIEMKEKTLILEAILYIQEGVNPNTLSEKLKSFLNPKELAKLEQLDKGVQQ